MNSAENQSNPFTSNCNPCIQLDSFVCPMSLLPLLQIVSASVVTEYRHRSTIITFHYTPNSRNNQKIAYHDAS